MQKLKPTYIFKKKIEMSHRPKYQLAKIKNLKEITFMTSGLGKVS